MGEAIQFRKVTKRFAGNTVLDDINLDIPAGSVTVILGPSGSGKSTAALHQPSGKNWTVAQSASVVNWWATSKRQCAV